MSTKTTYRSPLKQKFFDQLRSELKAELKLGNVHEVPVLEKIVLNVGTGRKADDAKANETVVNTLRKITGQQPVATTAKKAIAGFKLTKGKKIGYKVTLRGDRMYDFFDRFVTVVLPRLRDFHGVSAKSFDKQGNYSVGLKEQSVFPELSFEDTASLHGLQVNFVINTDDPELARALLKKLGMPFEKGKQEKNDNN